jgi:hypothetical protein
VDEDLLDLGLTDVADDLGQGSRQSRGGPCRL